MGLKMRCERPQNTGKSATQAQFAILEKNAKGPQGSVLYCVPGIGARFAHVGKVSGVLTQNGLAMIEA